MNKQLRETLVRNDTIDVHSIFRTIQGEGPYAGSPALFVRLAGCNLQCPGCDTDYTEGRQLCDIPMLVERIVCEKHSTDIVVITGGEPFRQGQALVSLCNTLMEKLEASDHRCITVQIETNGTLYAEGLTLDVDIVVSPKAPHMNEQLIPLVRAYKYVIEHGKVSPSDGLPTQVLGSSHKDQVFRPKDLDISIGKIYVQPMDSGNPEDNAKNLAAAIESCMQYGYTLCLQLHKILGME